MIREKLDYLTAQLRQRLSSPTNALGRYRTIAVGQRGNSALLIFELINTLILPLPGWIGRRARSLLLPLVCGKIGRSVRIGTDCTLRNPARIQVGDGVIIEDRVCLDVKPHAHGLIIGRNVMVGRRTICNCAGGIINIGDGTRIAPFSRLGSRLGLQIGRNCRIGEEVCCSGAAHAYADRSRPIVLQAVTCKGPTSIGDFVVIGDRATILDGVKIGNNVLIAADSLVNRDLPDNSIAAGVPAEILPPGGR
jgi:acetyltransferase-like isoleucine patch superfamily enzyme